jgi:hypothetical protein
VDGQTAEALVKVAAQAHADICGLQRRKELIVAAQAACRPGRRRLHDGMMRRQYAQSTGIALGGLFHLIELLKGKRPFFPTPGLYAR